jgi:hypothetical protein
LARPLFCWPANFDLRSSTFSGNNPGIQRAATFAGKARRKGARAVSEAKTPLLSSAEVTRTRLRRFSGGVPLARERAPGIRWTAMGSDRPRTVT